MVCIKTVVAAQIALAALVLAAAFTPNTGHYVFGVLAGVMLLVLIGVVDQEVYGGIFGDHSDQVLRQ